MKFEEKFKSAIEFLEKSDIYSPNKPAIPHLKNVAKYLFEKEFSDEVVLAGLFHDMLEWSSVTAEELENKFGSKVVSLFFQAEDGIRDWSVTGVQTCALPI